MVKRLLISLLIIASYPAFAAHLVGGEITYKCLGNNDYEVTLIIYRDCFSSGAPFDPFASITIYSSSNTIIQDIDVPMLGSSRLPVEAPNSCTVLPLSVCTERAIYRFTTNLPPRAGGYTINHQRCCRNATIRNVTNSDDWGNTYTVNIPSNDVGCNSSPAFNDTPPVVLCIDQPLNLDMSASDADGDSLHYELCSPLHGGGKNSSSTGFDSPKPGTAAPPPYTAVPFAQGFTASDPITSSNPTISIDPLTGVLSGRPTQVGQYVFAICVTEYRSGVPVSTVRRDFQFNVSNACKTTISQMETQDINPSTICNGLHVDFFNLSRNATTYRWDFGDSTTLGDTSWVKHPTYTYPDTGTYSVTLIANPGDVCADTTVHTFKLNYALTITHERTGEVCFNTNTFDFTLSGNYSNNATAEWNFGGATNVGFTSKLLHPKNIQFLQPGVYWVQATVKDFGCEDIVFDTIEVVDNPDLSHVVPETEVCVNVPIKFRDASTASSPISHFWDFGDGNTSKAPSPTHAYQEPGVYTVIHTIQTFEGCKDSLYEVFPDRIRIYSKPVSKLKTSEEYLTIYDPVLLLTNLSENFTHTETFIRGFQTLESFKEQTIVFEDTGTYIITHIAYNENGCSDSTLKTVFVEAPLNIYVPNAFTPNGDGINDLFTFKITGAESFVIRIFNRWGELVYESSDMDEGWNGRVRNVGSEASDGLYTYQLVVGTSFRARDITKHGTVTLLR